MTRTISSQYRQSIITNTS